MKINRMIIESRVAYINGSKTDSAPGFLSVWEDPSGKESYGIKMGLGDRGHLVITPNPHKQKVTLREIYFWLEGFISGTGLNELLLRCGISQEAL
jgi:hypothetical protein